LLLRPFFFLSAEQGGATIVQLAAEPELEGVTGMYFERGKAMAPAPLARDEALARRLWDVSAVLTT
ncbi:MAG TPA: short-chain dehydrogenase, partial [Thermoanaerobaculia bacterium]|nr:short-chain dehydrogenase [Thermoanaerobaculia bacterium]